MNISEVYFAPDEVKQRYYERCERQYAQLIRILQNPRYDRKLGTFMGEHVPEVYGRLRTLTDRMSETCETLGQT